MCTFNEWVSSQVTSGSVIYQMDTFEQINYPCLSYPLQRQQVLQVAGKEAVLLTRSWYKQWRRKVTAKSTVVTLESVKYLHFTLFRVLTAETDDLSAWKKVQVSREAVLCVDRDEGK